jgi:hypothetical protein
VYCPIAFLTLTLAQWQNSLWGFQMAWYLVVLALAVALICLDRPRLTWPFLLFAAVAGIVGSYSSLQGLLIWPVGLVLLYQRRREAWTIVAWMAIAVVTAFFGYIYHFTGSRSSSYASSHPFQDIKFFLYALGGILDAPIRPGAQADGPVMAFGIAVFVLAIFVLVRWGLRRDERSGMPIGVALILYGFLFDAFITDARVIFTPYAGAASRYTTNDVLVLVGIYLVTLSGASTRAAARQTSTDSAGGSSPAWHWSILERIDRTFVRRVIFALIAIQFVFSVHYGLQNAQQNFEMQQATAAATRNIDHESNGAIEYGLGIFLLEPPRWYRVQVHFLREHRLCLFE